MMQELKKKQYLYIMLAGFGAISLSIAFFFVIYRLRGIGEMLDSLSQILAPFIYGGVVAYLLRPMCNTFEQYLRIRLNPKLQKYSDILALMGSFITMALIIYALSAMIVPRVYDSLLKLGTSIPPRVDNLLTWANATFGENERLSSLLEMFNTSYATLYKEISNFISSEIVPQVTTFMSGLGSSVYKALHTVYNLLIGIIVAVYLLHSRKKFAAQGKLLIHSIFKENTAGIILNEISVIDRMFGGFIDAKILDSMIIGLLCYIGCAILRIPNMLLISVFVGITNIIPFFGPFIGAVPSTLLILIEEPVKAIWFIIFILILQQLDGNIIGPRIMGNRIGISGFWVMFAIVFFGGTMGLIGMVIGVPLFAVIYDLARKYVRRGLNRNNMTSLWDEYTALYPNEDTEVRPKEENGKKNVQEWTAEDWKTEMFHFLKYCKEDILKAYAFLKKAALFIWTKLVVAAKSIRKGYQIIVQKLKMLYNTCQKQYEKKRKKK